MINMKYDAAEACPPLFAAASVAAMAVGTDMQ
jgi:hypothetical protein